ncbi:MAG: hypothetical protein WC942_07920 [Clostridia bacterium]|jgi:hypothetical protein
MNFFNNRISMGKTKSFDDICKEIIEKKNKKEVLANSNNVIKTAESEEEKSSGQLEVEPLHQTGESTYVPAAGASAKKDDSSKASESSTQKSEKEECDSSGQPEWEGKQENNNDPEKKIAGSEKGPGIPDGTGPGKDSKECPFNKDKDDDKKDEKCPKCDKEECECEKEDDKKEAKVSPKFVKIANLDEKTKTWLKEYWGNIFDKNYAEAMVSDK